MQIWNKYKLLELKHRIEEEQKAESEHKKRRRRHHSKTYGQNSSSMPEFTAARGLLELSSFRGSKQTVNVDVSKRPKIRCSYAEMILYFPV